MAELALQGGAQRGGALRGRRRVAVGRRRVWRSGRARRVAPSALAAASAPRGGPAACRARDRERGRARSRFSEVWKMYIEKVQKRAARDGKAKLADKSVRFHFKG